MLRNVVKNVIAKFVPKKNVGVIVNELTVVEPELKVIVPTLEDIVVPYEESHQWDAVDTILIQRAIQMDGWSKIQAYYHPEQHPDDKYAWHDYQKVKEIYDNLKGCV